MSITEWKLETSNSARGHCRHCRAQIFKDEPRFKETYVRKYGDKSYQTYWLVCSRCSFKIIKEERRKLTKLYARLARKMRAAKKYIVLNRLGMK